MEITKQQFEAYEKVRQSGRTNMFDVRTVSALSGLDRAVIFEVMKQYSPLAEKYGKSN
jgi:hypothetical protein